MSFRFAPAILILALAAGYAGAEPYRPADDAVVIERLPAAASGSAVGALRALRAELARDPQDLDRAVDFARRAIALGRAEADPRFYGYAQAALEPWWALAEPPPETIYLRAVLRQNRHDFAAALEDLDRVLAARPRWAEAWLTRAVVLTVSGEPAEATRSCLPLQRLASPLVFAACTAHAASLAGGAEPSVALLERALAASPDAPAGVRQWALVTLGEIAARLGRPELAETRFREALATGERDVYLLAAYADLLLAQGRPAEVRALLEDETRIDALLLRLAIAEKRSGVPGLDARVEELRARFAGRASETHQGAEARFRLELLEEPGAALALAERNWTHQREPIDARLLLEAALAAGEPRAARPVLEWLERTGLEDVKLASLAAQIKKELA